MNRIASVLGIVCLALAALAAPEPVETWSATPKVAASAEAPAETPCTGGSSCEVKAFAPTTADGPTSAAMPVVWPSREVRLAGRSTPSDPDPPRPA